MLEFHPVSLADRDPIRAKLAAEPRLGCEYGFGNIFSYSAKYPILVGETGGCFFTRCVVDDYDYYCFPVGGDKRIAIRDLIESARRVGKASELYGMTEADAAILEEAYPGRFVIEKARDSFDYVYTREDLVSLAGKKYQSKRNHISFFMRNCRWSYEPITPETIPECLAMSEQWLEQNKNEYQDDLVAEFAIIQKAFANYEALGYVGGLLRADGKVVAYTMGEPLTDEMFCVHIEKAFADVRGAYPMINRLFAEQSLGGYRYINREDDVGHDNLRKAKLSYHPAFFVEKYEARIL